MSTHSYTAFGLTVASDLDLDGFRSLDGPPGRYDATVRVGQPSVSADGVGRVSAFADGVLSASVIDGEEITVSPEDGVDPHYLSAVVTGELFSVLLRQRGLLVLHGSAVSKDGRAVGFIGDSGWGKSTLAASLVARGWRLLTDDLLVVEGLGGGGGGGSDARGRAGSDAGGGAVDGPLVVPSHASMRLSEAAVASVGSRSAQPAGRAHTLTTKLKVDWSDDFSDRPTPLHRVFALDPRPSGDHQAVPLSARDAATQFIYHTRGQKLLSGPSARVAHLGRCADLSRRVRTLALRRRDGLSEIDGLCAVVESEASGEQAASAHSRVVTP